MIDGSPIYTKTALKENLKELRLTEDKQKPAYLESIGVSISCVTRPKNNIDGSPGPIARSDPFFAGIKVLNTAVNLRRSESVQIFFNFTVPFGCGWQSEHVWAPCELEVQIFSEQDPNTCAGRVTTSSVDCHKKIKIEDWDKPQSISIDYQDKGVYNIGYPNIYYIQLATPNGGFHPIWFNYFLPRIKVTMKEDEDSTWKGKTCSSQNDPHMTTFDGRKYENQNPGIFILYENSDFELRPMQVQIRLRDCNRPGIYCNCGVAVRAGGDVFVIDFCYENRVMQFMTCHDKILDVRRYDKNKFIYNIFLPSGTEVEVNLYYSGSYKQYNLNVKIRASMYDNNKTRGLCGMMTHDCRDDFVLRDGNYSKVAGSNHQCNGQHFYALYPNDFSRSWRIANDESLFHLTENQDMGMWTDQHMYCTCPGVGENGFLLECTKESVVTCERDKYYKKLGQAMCQVLSRKRSSSVSYPWKSAAKRRKKRAMAQPKDNTVNMTPEEARTYCQETIGNVAAFTACSTVPNVPTEETIDICAMDIILTNSTDWVAETLETLKMSCITELQKNDTLQEEDEDGQSLADKVESVVCPGLPECGGNGICINGTCKCESGFIEVDCSVDLSEPPEIIGLRGEGICDLQDISCDTAFLVGETISYSNNLSCKIQDFVVLRNRTRIYTNEYKVDANIETVIEMHCPVRTAGRMMPNNSIDETFVVGHIVSVSYDRLNFGEDFEMFVYDSSCQEPVIKDNVTTFNLVAKTCFIEEKCHAHGSTKTNESCLICNSESPYQWSQDLTNTACIVVAVGAKNDNNITWIAGPIIAATIFVCSVIVAFVIYTKQMRHVSKVAELSRANDVSLSGR